MRGGETRSDMLLYFYPVISNAWEAYQARFVAVVRTLRFVQLRAVCSTRVGDHKISVCVMLVSVSLKVIRPIWGIESGNAEHITE